MERVTEIYQITFSNCELIFFFILIKYFAIYIFWLAFFLMENIAGKLDF